MRVVLFLVVVGVLLLGAAYSTRKTQTIGSYKHTTYGWPEPWVYKHEMGKTTEWRLDWQAMAIPGTVVFCITALGLLILWWQSVREKNAHTE